MSGKVLFACSKCFTRHPFESLSSGEQVCKNCRGNSSVVKCTYCRSEFQQTSNKTTSTCKKCEYSLKQFGKPSACECCNIVAAFGNSKCLRCASYESKYGPPVTCDECKQRSAFDKRDENKKVNGKLLCWLCTCAFKRALIKAHQEGRISKKRSHEKSHREHSGGASAAKRSSQQRSTDLSTKTATSSSSGLELPEKISRQGGGGSGGNGGGTGGTANNANGNIPAPGVVTVDQTSSDHVVAMTQLKERIAGLERRLTLKDKELFEKDKQLTELKGKNFEKEIEMRNKLKENDRLNDLKVDNLNKKVSSLMKEVAGLKRTNRKNGANKGISAGGGGNNNQDKDSVSTKDSGGSGTDSPSTN